MAGDQDVSAAVSADDTIPKHRRSHLEDMLVHQWVRAVPEVAVSAAASMIAAVVSAEAEEVVDSEAASIEAAAAEDILTALLPALEVDMEVEVALATEEATTAGSAEEGEVDATTPTSNLCRPEVVVAATETGTAMGAVEEVAVEEAETRTTLARRDHTTAAGMTILGSAGGTRAKSALCEKRVRGKAPQSPSDEHHRGQVWGKYTNMSSSAVHSLADISVQLLGRQTSRQRNLKHLR